jgi:hypothetical protein
MMTSLIYHKVRLCTYLLICWFSLNLTTAFAADDLEKQHQVAERGRLIMPFSLEKTEHQFFNTKTGGIQRLVVRDGVDDTQIKLIRQHLQAMQAAFMQGDFSWPESIHGANMPGLAQLKAAKPGSLLIEYAEQIDGASLTYSSKRKTLIKALHVWFAAQVHDHGDDAVAMPHCPHHQ